jgi:hypothetical protein
MPGMDGFTLCRTLKDDPLHADIPVVLLTRLASLNDIVQALESGADSFVRKPYDGVQLRARLRRILQDCALGAPDRPLEFMAAERRQIYELLVATHAQALRMNAELADQRCVLERSCRSLAILHGMAAALNEAVGEQAVAEAALAHLLAMPGLAGAAVGAVDAGGASRRWRRAACPAGDVVRPAPWCGCRCWPRGARSACSNCCRPARAGRRRALPARQRRQPARLRARARAPVRLHGSAGGGTHRGPALGAQPIVGGGRYRRRAGAAGRAVRPHRDVQPRLRRSAGLEGQRGDRAAVLGSGAPRRRRTGGAARVPGSRGHAARRPHPGRMAYARGQAPFDHLDQDPAAARRRQRRVRARHRHRRHRTARRRGAPALRQQFRHAHRPAQPHAAARPPAPDETAGAGIRPGAGLHAAAPGPHAADPRGAGPGGRTGAGAGSGMAAARSRGQRRHRPLQRRQLRGGGAARRGPRTWP